MADGGLGTVGELDHTFGVDLANSVLGGFRLPVGQRRAHPETVDDGLSVRGVENGGEAADKSLGLRAGNHVITISRGSSTGLTLQRLEATQHTSLRRTTRILRVEIIFVISCKSPAFSRATRASSLSPVMFPSVHKH